METKTRALMDYAVEVTQRPERCSAESIAALRSVGWSDAQIHDATQVVALFNYFTRLAHALGVEPEDFMPPR